MNIYELTYLFVTPTLFNFVIIACCSLQWEIHNDHYTLHTSMVNHRIWQTWWRFTNVDCYKATQPKTLHEFHIPRACRKDMGTGYPSIRKRAESRARSRNIGCNPISGAWNGGLTAWVVLLMNLQNLYLDIPGISIDLPSNANTCIFSENKQNISIFTSILHGIEVVRSIPLSCCWGNSGLSREPPSVSSFNSWEDLCPELQTGQHVSIYAYIKDGLHHGCMNHCSVKGSHDSKLPIYYISENE